MPVPRWVATLNRKVFNPREIRKGKRPVLHHVGRRSRLPRLTPLDAHRVDGGYLFFPMYGPESDWVQNVLAEGEAVLSTPDGLQRLVEPKLVDRAAAKAMLPDGVDLPRERLGISQFLVMRDG